MMTNAKIGVALIGGYFLGRTKKAKMALGLGLFLAGKKLDPKQLGTLVANSPVLGPLNDQVRKELVDATKAAAGTALTQRMSGLADSLHERTVALNEGGGVSGGIERTAEDEHSAADDEEQAHEDDARGDAEDAADTEDAEGTADDEKESAPRRKASADASAKTATKSATKPATKSSAASAKKSGSAARSTARRASSSASGTSKSSGKNTGGASRGRPAHSSARKTASGARKKASGAARTAADRGGRND